MREPFDKEKFLMSDDSLPSRVEPKPIQAGEDDEPVIRLAHPEVKHKLVREDLVREKLAQMMISQSIATGHGDTFEDLLATLEADIRELRAQSLSDLGQMQDALERAEKAEAELAKDTDMSEIKPATDEEIAEIEALYAKTPNTSWDFSIGECMELIARIRKAETRVVEMTAHSKELERQLNMAENDYVRECTAEVVKLRAALEVLQEDKVEGLEADLDSAVEIAFKYGALDWVRLNYPRHYERFAARAALTGKGE